MRRWMLGLALAGALAAPAWAGPPFVTDDPQPTDTGHWEIYNFGAGVGTPGDVAGEGGLDLNYGAAKDLQLTAVLPASFDNNRFGSGVIELAAKYKLLHQADGSWLPDVAIFPRVFLDTGSSFDGTTPGVFLPVWAEKDFGPWSLFGGGGFQIATRASDRDFWQTGLALQRTLGKRASLGVEVIHQTPTSPDGADFTAVNVGATYKLSEHWTLMASGGPGLQNARTEGQYLFYAALEATY
jgi:hypothetical protein